MKISIVIPVYNGARTIRPLVEELFKDLSGYGLEIVMVNDGSPDNSHDACFDILKKYKKGITYLRLAKNFGEHNAVLAGLNHVSGDYAVIIDDDFQNPPSEIKKLVDTAIEGKYDVVYSYYAQKRHSWFRNIGSRFNDRIANYLLDKPHDLYLSSFKCMNKFTVDEIVKYKGPYPYIDGLILRTTRNIGRAQVQHDARQEGRSGYNLRKLVRLWLNMFVNFSVYPLRLSTFFGFLFSIFGGIASIFLIIDRLVHPDTPIGLTSIMVGILTFSGLQLIILGIMGEYIGKQFLAANQTPQYVIRNVYTEKAEGQGNA